MGKIKQLLIQEQEREYNAHEEWLLRRHEEEANGAAEQLDTLEHHGLVNETIYPNLSKPTCR